VRELLQHERDTPGSSPPLRPVRSADFETAITKISASVSADASSLIALKEWNRKFGRAADRKQANLRYGF
jgi:hypothetical protein